MVLEGSCGTAHRRELVVTTGLLKAGWSAETQGFRPSFQLVLLFWAFFCPPPCRVCRSKGAGRAAWFYLAQLRQSQQRSGLRGEL